MIVNTAEFIPGTFAEITMDLFKTKDDITYATINGKNFNILGSELKDFINKGMYEQFKFFLSKSDLDEIIDKCDTFARVFGEAKPVFRRIGRSEGTINIDRGTPNFDVIEITSNSVRKITNPSVKFIRSRIQRPIGDINTEAQPQDLFRLKEYVPFKTDEDFILFVAWLMSCLNTFGGYPPMFLVGEQGSAKSTTSAFIKNLLDESAVPLRNLSTGMRNLMIAASNDFILCYDNISKISDNQSDNLCKLSTGAGFTTRKLYTTNEEVQLLCKNPIVINSIAVSPTRQDLADRSVIVNLTPIRPEDRKTSKEIWENWEQDRPAIMGALCHAVSAALRNFDQVDEDSLPRMADFARWVIAGEDGLPWENGTFLKAMQNLRNTMVEEAIDADSTALAVLKLMKEREHWAGKASTLLEDLTNCIEQDKHKYPDFPKLPNQLSRNLNRISAFLREKGLLFNKAHSGQRSITLTNIGIEKSVDTEGAKASPHEAPRMASPDEMALVRKTFGGVAQTEETPADNPQNNNLEATEPEQSKAYSEASSTTTDF